MTTYTITKKGIEEGFFDEEGEITFLESVDGFALQLVAFGALEPKIDIDIFKP